MFNVLYEITNLVNGKRYIGSHMTDDIHDDYLGSGNLIRAAVAKYGEENFQKRVFAFAASEANLDHLESLFVTEKEAADPTYYNLTPGGNRPPKGTSEVAKKAYQTKLLRGTYVPPPLNIGGVCGGNKGVKLVFSPERGQKISAAKKGVSIGPMSQAQKEAIGAGNRGKVRTEEQKQRYSEAARKREYNKKVA
jgi:hypothetical protein